MSKQTELLRQARARREEARSRRSLARLAAAQRPQGLLGREAHELEVEAARLEQDARRPAAERPGKSQRARGPAKPGR